MLATPILAGRMKCVEARWKRPCPYHVTEATYGGRPRLGLEIPVTGEEWPMERKQMEGAKVWGARDKVPSGRCWWQEPALRVFGLSLSSKLSIFREIQHFYLVSLITQLSSFCELSVVCFCSGVRPARGELGDEELVGGGERTLSH